MLQNLWDGPSNEPSQIYELSIKDKSIVHRITHFLENTKSESCFISLGSLNAKMLYVIDVN